MREGYSLYTSICDWSQGYGPMNLFLPRGMGMLDYLPQCLLYRQEGYIPSNYVTEAEDSIEMYE